MVRAASLLILALGAGCEAVPCPRGSMLESDGGLIVTEAEHPTGWGEADCTLCHVPATLHDQGCTPDVDLAEIDAMVEEEGVDACATCHGDNGVQP